MRFAMFYEIPVVKSWTKTELEAYRNTIEQVKLGVVPTPRSPSSGTRRRPAGTS